MAGFCVGPTWEAMVPSPNELGLPFLKHKIGLGL